MSFAQAANGRHCRRSDLAVQAPYIPILPDGNVLAFSAPFGAVALQNTMTWKALLGNGKA